MAVAWFDIDFVTQGTEFANVFEQDDFHGSVRWPFTRLSLTLLINCLTA